MGEKDVQFKLNLGFVIFRPFLLLTDKLLKVQIPWFFALFIWLLSRKMNSKPPPQGI